MQSKSASTVSKMSEYKIIEQIGEGTYGTVYKAAHIES